MDRPHAKQTPEYQLRKWRQRLSATIDMSRNRTLRQLAPHLLNAVVEKEAEFNNYSGNLEAGYTAYYFRRGRKVKYFMYNSHAQKTARYGQSTKSGKIKVYLTPPTRHRMAATWKKNRFRNLAKKNRRGRQYDNSGSFLAAPYRYMKEWENQRGYEYIARRQFNYRGVHKMNGDGTYIEITNVAPYAAFLQAGSNMKKHYNVIRGARSKVVKNGAAYGAILMKTVLKKELRQMDIKVR